jgi:hypothetical protein
MHGAFGPKLVNIKIASLNSIKEEGPGKLLFFLKGIGRR